MLLYHLTSFDRVDVKMSGKRAAFGHFEIIAHRAAVSFVILHVIISFDIVDFKMSGPRAAFGHFEIIANRAVVSYIMLI